MGRNSKRTRTAINKQGLDGKFISILVQSDEEENEEIREEIELLNDEGEIVDNKLDDYISIDENLNLIEKDIKNFETRWNSVGNNSNVRYFGTSKRTYYYNKENEIKLETNAKLHSQPITKFFSSISNNNNNIVDLSEVNDYEYIQEKLNDNEKKDQFYSYIEAINFLNNSYAKITKDTASNNNIDKFLYTVAISILRYLQLLVDGESKMKASQLVASIMYGKKYINSYKATCLRKWADEFMSTRNLPVFNQGKHIKIATIINDNNVKLYLTNFIRSQDINNRNPQFLKQQLAEGLLLEKFNIEARSYSERTILNWFYLLGFHHESKKKGYYTDQHNSEFNVIDRNTRFLPKMQEIERRMVFFDGENMEIIIPANLKINEKNICFITHDESTCYTNISNNGYWMHEDGKTILLPKSNGQSLMISAFMCACCGIISDGDCKSYKLFEAGSNREGWFCNEDLIAQFEKVVKLFENKHPNHDFVWCFDNSMNHRKASPDGLDANIGLNDNGVNAKLMRRTKFKCQYNDLWYV